MDTREYFHLQPGDVIQDFGLRHRVAGGNILWCPCQPPKTAMTALPIIQIAAAIAAPSSRIPATQGVKRFDQYHPHSSKSNSVGSFIAHRPYRPDWCQSIGHP